MSINPLEINVHINDVGGDSFKQSLCPFWQQLSHLWENIYGMVLWY